MEPRAVHGDGTVIYAHGEAARLAALSDQVVGLGFTVEFGFMHACIASGPSREEAQHIVKEVEVLVLGLAKEEPLPSLAEAYFKLKGQQARLLETLSPLVVAKSVADGHCAWSPENSTG